MKKIDLPKLIESFKNTKQENRAELIFGCESNPSDELFAFLQKVCLDDREYDLARIEAIKSMTLTALKLSSETQSIAADTLIDLCNDDDNDIQTYALQALAWLPYDKKIIAPVLNKINPSIYIITRESALAALTKHIDQTEVRDALKTLLNDSDFGEYIRSII